MHIPNPDPNFEQVKADKAKTDEFRKSLAKLVRPNPNPNPKA